MELEPSDDLEVNLESEVVAALSRLQRKNMGNKSKIVGVSLKTIVKFLKMNCSWLDGDLDSQVMTALLSCVKMGLVCILEQGSYRLVQPTSKNMISKCMNLVSHGPKCSCLTTLKGLTSYRRPCCVVKANSVPSDKKPRERSKRPAEQKCNKKKKRNTTQKTRRKSAKPAPRSMEINLGKSAEAEQNKKKCQYCLEIHYIPPRPRRLCSQFRTYRTYRSVPLNTFSPRDETSAHYNYK